MKNLIILLYLVFLINLNATDMKNVKFEDFVQFVSHISQKNIIISDNVEKDFNIFFPDYDTLDSEKSIILLENVCRLNKLSFSNIDDVYLISKFIEPSKNELSHVIKFNHLSNTEVKSILSSFDLKNLSILKHRIFFISDFNIFTKVSKMIKLLDSSYLQKQLKVLIFTTTNNLTNDVGIDFKYDFTNYDSYIRLITSKVNLTAVVPDPVQFISFINLLSLKGYVDVLSNPVLNIVDGKTSLIQDSYTIPFKTQTTITKDSKQITQDSFQYKDVGLKLLIKNTILSDNYAEFDLRIDYQSIIEKSITPVISNKVLITHVTLRNNEYLLIGGIIAKEKIDDISNIPILENIPVINYLTRHKIKTISDKTFSIVLTIRNNK